MGQDYGDQHGLLLTSGTIGGGLVLARHRHRQFVAMGAGQGALRGPIPAARILQGCGQRRSLARPAGLIVQGGPGEGFSRKGAQHGIEAVHHPRTRGGDFCSGQRDLFLDAVQPMRIGCGCIGEQAIALSHRVFQSCRTGSVARFESEHQTIEEPAPRARAFDEQPVHGWREPADAQPFGQPIGGRGSLVDPHQPLAGSLGIYRGAQRHWRIVADQHGTCREAAATVARRNVRQNRAAQAAAGCEQ